MDESDITASIRIDTATKQGSDLHVIHLVNPTRETSTASQAFSALKQVDEQVAPSSDAPQCTTLVPYYMEMGCHHFPKACDTVRTAGR